MTSQANEPNSNWARLAAESATVSVALGATCYFMGIIEQRFTLERFSLTNSFQFDTYQLMAKGLLQLAVAIIAIFLVFSFVEIAFALVTYFNRKMRGRFPDYKSYRRYLILKFYAFFQNFPVLLIGGPVVWFAGWALLFGYVGYRIDVKDFNLGSKCQKCRHYIVGDKSSIFGISVASDVKHVAILKSDHSVVLLDWDDIESIRR